MAYWQIPAAPDPETPAVMGDYLQGLTRRGFSPSEQGVWVGSDWDEFASARSRLPLSAASLTKIATTLAALERWGPNDRTVTAVEVTGEVVAGTVRGDLIVRGGGDPLFVWEDAIAIGQALNRAGIERVAGDLIVVGPFHLNFADEDPVVALQQALGAQRWSAEIARQFEEMDSVLPPPEIEIGGEALQKISLREGRRVLVYRSLSLAQILQQMNAYSNNVIAERLADRLGGGPEIARVARATAGITAAEIQLINGSGLGFENRISPRAATQMLSEISRQLEDTPLTVADLFPVGELNPIGTIAERDIPRGAAVKTGSLWRASALAGAIPTADRGWVYFAIVNQGTPIVPLREAQDRFLAALTRDWLLEPVPLQLAPIRFGDPARVQLVEPDTKSASGF